MTSAFVGVVGLPPTDALTRLAAGFGAAQTTRSWGAEWVTVAWQGGQVGDLPPSRLVVGRLFAGPDDDDPLRRLRSARGRFALAELDLTRRRVVLAVDHLGAGGLFVHQGGAGGTWFASELNLLLRALPHRPAPDDVAVVRRLADGLVPRGRTLYAGVDRLKGGQCLSIDGDKILRREYWAPAYLPAEEGDAERSGARLLEAARDAVARSLEPAGPDELGVLLSGGLDSVTVAALARRGGQARPRAYTAVFPDRPELDEQTLAVTAGQYLDIPTRLLSVRGSAAVGSSLDYLDQWGLPSVSPNLFFQRPLLALARTEGTRLMLDGQGGDELFGHAAYLLGDRLRRGAWRSTIELARRFPGAGDRPSARVVGDVLLRFGVRGAAPRVAHDVRRRLSTGGPRWLAPAAARLQADASERWDWKRGAAPLWWREQADELTAQRERMEAHDFLRRKEVSAGIEGAHPFLDDVDLVEAMLRLPPEHAFDASLDRALLRRAVRGLIPEEVRVRRDKAWFDRLFVASLSGPDQQVISAVLGAPDAEVSAYVRPDVVRHNLLETAPSARGGRWAWTVWRLFTTECWLRTEKDPLFAEQLRERFSLGEATFSVD